MFRLLCKLFFEKIGGWKITGSLPKAKKYLIIVAPHTSNWDFPIGLAVRSLWKFDSKFMGKKELFNFPFGWLFRALGGYPVDRSKKTNMVDAVAEIFNSKEEFIVAIAPEGTRAYVSHWKTGFYHIAVKAHVPVVMAGIDYSKKTVYFAEAFQPSGNIEKDMKIIAGFFIDKKGKFEKKWPEEFYAPGEQQSEIGNQNKTF